MPARATVGGAIATGDQGPRGAAYGSVRDVVLGLRATLADGTAVKFGGRTMKNVAGYDMTKLFVGSFGCLGVITEITFRLLPRPAVEAVVLLPLRVARRGGGDSPPGSRLVSAASGSRRRSRRGWPDGPGSAAGGRRRVCRWLLLRRGVRRARLRRSSAPSVRCAACRRASGDVLWDADAEACSRR